MENGILSLFAENGKQKMKLDICIHTVYAAVFHKIKRKTEDQAIFLNLLPFAHLANGNSSFDRLLTKKQTEVIRF